MKLLLRQPVPHLGRSGDLVNVSEPYARNFLLPKKLAVVATPAMMAQAGQQAAKLEASRAKEQEKSTQAQAKTQGLHLIMKVKANDQGKLFAAMKSDQVYQAMSDQLQLNFPAPQFEPDHWKRIGEYPVTLHWPGGVTSTMTLTLNHG